MFKIMHDMPNIWLRTTKNSRYETIDFVFKPRHVYKLKTIKPTVYKIPNVPYMDQYESRDF